MIIWSATRNLLKVSCRLRFQMSGSHLQFQQRQILVRLTSSSIREMRKASLLVRCIRIGVVRTVGARSLNNSPDTNISTLLNEARSNEPEANENNETLFPSDIEERERAYRRHKQDQARHSLRPNVDPTLTSIVLFPGQGSQFVGMGKKLLHYPNVKEIYSKAGSLLGYNLLDLCLYGPKEKLDSTIYSQPALYVTSMAAAEKLKDDFPLAIDNCVAAAGFSVGEYAALVYAGALTFEQGLRLVHARAKAMQEVGDSVAGGMMSVFVRADSRLRLACKTAEEYCKVKLGIEQPVCRIANYLSPDCKVVAGNKEALQFIQDHLHEFLIRKVKLLPVSGAFHTSQMLPAVSQLRLALKRCTFKQPLVPVHCNYSGKRYMTPESIANLLCKQMVSPVKWEQTLHILYSREQGHSFPNTYEVGPGKQLGTLLKVVNAKAHASYKNVDV